VLFGKEATPQGASKAARSRRSAVRAAIFLVVAAFCAVGAAVIFTRYMDARTAALRVPTERVVVAAVDIPVASPIKLEWLTVIDWPRISRPEGAQEDPASIVGKVAYAPITKGEAILATKLVASAGRSGLATLLPSGARAVSVRVDDVVGVAGFIHPGDRVDVIVTMQPRNDTLFASKLILQNVRVLAVNQDLEHRGRDAEKAATATVATLQVSPEESEALALAAARGKLLLALRGASDTDLAVTRGVVPTALLAAAAEPPPAPSALPTPSRAVARPARRAPSVQAVPVAQAAPPPKESQVIEILRGDLFEKRDFARTEKRP
jgi:pilus assembly protein CpaB